MRTSQRTTTTYATSALMLRSTQRMWKCQVTTKGKSHIISTVPLLTRES